MENSVAAHQARLLAQQGKYDEALDQLHVALQVAPAASDWALWASLKLRIGSTEEAELGYRRALELNPSEPSWEAALNDLTKRVRNAGHADLRRRQGRHLLETGQAAEAAQVLYEAIQLQESADLWNDWASAHFLMEQYADAEAGYARALTLDPASALAAGNLAVTLHRMHRDDEALPWARKALASATDQTRPVWRSLIAECESGRPAGASTAVFSSPVLPETARALGRLIERVGKLQQTVEDIHKRMPKPPALSDERIEPRTLLEQVPAGRLLPLVNQPRLLLAAFSAHPLPLLDRWVLAAIAAALPAGDLLHWGPCNGLTLDLAAQCAAGAQVWHVADPDEDLKTLQTALPDAVADEIGNRIRQAPLQSPGFTVSSWLGRMRLIVVDCEGTAAQIRQFTRNVLPFFAAHDARLVWYGYGRRDSVTLALNELYLSEPGFHRLVHIADTGLAVLAR